jgi:transcriptional regulator with XRE-family HTH domain
LLEFSKMKARDKAEEAYLIGLGGRIAEIRREKRMTQVELSLRCEIEKSNMRRIEAGNTNPTVLTLRKICMALEIAPQDLYAGLAL